MNEALRPDDTRDALRKIGGLLVGVGALMLFTRKEGDWGNFALLLVYVIPAVLLYGGALATREDTGGLRPWQAVFSVFGLLFIPLALGQLVEMIGNEGDAGKALNVFWISAATAGAAFYAAKELGVRFHLLLAGLAGTIAWMALWQKIIGFEDDLGMFRLFLALAAVGLLIAGIAIWRSKDDDTDGVWGFSELLTASGIAAVTCAALGITAVANQVGLPLGAPVFENSLFWELVLLAVSLGLIGVGANIGSRGPVYIGALGLTFFLVMAGADIGDDSPDPTKVVGWPLFLLLGGGAALAISGVKDVSAGEGPRESINKLGGR